VLSVDACLYTLECVSVYPFASRQGEHLACQHWFDSSLPRNGTHAARLLPSGRFDEHYRAWKSEICYKLINSRKVPVTSELPTTHPESYQSRILTLHFTNSGTPHQTSKIDANHLRPLLALLRLPGAIEWAEPYGTKCTSGNLNVLFQNGS
jgi:hypothetical protein